MKDLKEIMVAATTPMIDVIRVIDKSALGIALVVDENRRLKGTITDGDIRRAILRNLSLTTPAAAIMNLHPTVARMNDHREALVAQMREKGIKHLPVVDADGVVMHMEILSELLQLKKRENWVVLMAGGLGKRLHPLTDDCPKPLLKVGNKPILETILLNLKEDGFSKFFISVNYKAEMIEDYFGDGSKWGVEIQYLREKERLGTAGALSLLPEIPTQPLLIMNGDLLTKINFGQLLDFHTEHQACATMCVREYSFEVPYGVVELDKQRLTGIVEKPVQHFFVNAGVYVLEPKALKFIPKNVYFDMPTLFEVCIREQYETAAFPIREYWLDIGRMGDFERANGEFYEVFAND